MNEVKLFHCEILFFLILLNFSHALSFQNNRPFNTSHINQVSDKLFAGSILKEGEFIISKNKQYKAILKSNGLLVLYKLYYHPFSKEKLWKSNNYFNCYKSNNTFRLSMQMDGNLVIYDKNSTVFWESGTYGKGRPKQYLKISNNGKLRIKDNIKTKLWKNKRMYEGNSVKQQSLPSNKLTFGQNLLENQRLISQNGKFTLIMQSDGDLGLYKIRNKRLIRKWISNTKNKGFLPFRLSIVENGNIVLFDKYKRRIWTLRANKKSTNITKSGELVIQNDGNLIHLVDNYLVWTSKTKE